MGHWALRCALIAGCLLALSWGRPVSQAAADALPWLTRPPDPAALGVGAAAGVALAALARLYLRALAALAIPTPARRDLPRRPAALIAVAVAIGPVVEEALVRGFVLGGVLLPARGPTAALLASSLVFAAAHPVQSTPWALMCGLALGALTLWAGSIWPAVIAHALVNGWAVAAILRRRGAQEREGRQGR